MISPVSEIIEEARKGRMVILVDDESRENEGDLCIPADCITPEAINFMARYGRGLICMPMSGAMADHLQLPQMVPDNQSSQQTAFTISIGARQGITTGISAADRAHTIRIASAPNAGRADLVSPGHVFPLRARDGGVIERAGHTEAAVDLAKLAGFSAAGVICEIMNDDGTMARMPQLIEFARIHNLKIGAITDLVEFQKSSRKDKAA